MVLCHNYVSKTYLFFIIITACEEELYLIRLYCYIFWSSVFVAFFSSSSHRFLIGIKDRISHNIFYKGEGYFQSLYTLSILLCVHIANNIH